MNAPNVLPLNPACEPPLGAHLLTPRRAYMHHGIYVGQGQVVQYGGLCAGLRRGPVEEVAVSRFSQGRPIYVCLEDSRRFDRNEVVRRARSRLGENRYKLLTNNCEHFCEWCVHGVHRSYQVDGLTARCATVWRRVLGLFGGEPSAAGACGDII